MKNVFFKPFIGINYQSKGFNEKKILVLGESHYCGGCDNCGNLQDYDEECREFTTSVVNKFLSYKKGEIAYIIRHQALFHTIAHLICKS